MTRLDDPAVKVVVERECIWCSARPDPKCFACDGAGVVYIADTETLPSQIDVPA